MACALSISKSPLRTPLTAFARTVRSAPVVLISVIFLFPFDCPLKSVNFFDDKADVGKPFEPRNHFYGALAAKSQALHPDPLMPLTAAMLELFSNFVYRIIPEIGRASCRERV